MRFSDLKTGDHFFFEGIAYTKTSPVLASDASGKSRIIPRSAELQAHPSQSPQPTPAAASELDQLYQAITTIIRQEVQDSDLEVRLRHAIEKAWRNIRDVAD